MSSLEKWISDSLQKVEFIELVISEFKYSHSLWIHPSIGEAEEIAVNLLTDFNDKFEDCDHSDCVAVRAFLLYALGCIQVNNEELESGLTCLYKSWDQVKGKSLDPKFCMLSLNILNQISMYYLEKRQDFMTVLTYLKQAECLYVSYKEKYCICPHDITYVFHVNPDEKKGWTIFEASHSCSLFCFAHLYDYLKDIDNANKFCSMYLSRYQYVMDIVPNICAIKVACASFFYVQNKEYITARHLLSCASYILSQYVASANDDEVDKNKIAYFTSEISMRYVFYCSCLLSDCTLDDFEQKIHPRPGRLLSEPEVLETEVNIPLTLSTLSAAKKLFRLGKSHLNIARSSETFCKDPMKFYFLLVSYSHMFSVMYLYEKDLGEKMEMLILKASILKEALSKISFEAFPLKWQKATHWLAETYYAMITLKIKLIPEDLTNDQLEEAFDEVNTLALKTVQCTESFLESLKDKHGKFPDTYPDVLVRRVLLSHIYLGRLYRNVFPFVSSLSETLNYSDKIGKHYNFILDYVKKNPHHRRCIETEMPEIESAAVCYPQP